MFYRNPKLHNQLLPVDIVLHPSWWFHNEGITFDEDFFFNPSKRVEVEKKMENVLYERWGRYGLGEDRDKDLPVIGPVHQALSFLPSAMLGCQVDFQENAAPQVRTAYIDKLNIYQDAAFKSGVYKRFLNFREKLKKKFGYLKGDVDWNGILNTGLDLRGENLFLDFFDRPREVKEFFRNIANVIEKFAQSIQEETGTTSISVNRNVRHIREPVFLHGECSHSMISINDYENFLLTYDSAWSQKHRPFGIHYCGKDPHRYTESFRKILSLDFLDVGWGGDLKLLRKHLPYTFLNIRLSPVEIINQNVNEIEKIIINLVNESNNPWLTGVCCINMDDKVTDEKISTIFKTVDNLRQEYTASD